MVPAGPYGSFTTLSIGFDGGGPTSEPFTFTTPRRLLQVDAYNGANVASTVTLSCAGQTTRSQAVAARQLATIATGWSGTCTTVTVGSTNGWDTNFDNLVIDDGNAPLITNVQSSTTSVSATVTWTTNVASNSSVEYGPTISYGSSSPVDPTLGTGHSVTLNGLSGGTTYHYRVHSADADSNEGVSGDFTFGTASTACNPPVTSPIACENSKTGDPATAWDIPSHDAGDPSIQGFATDISYNRGQTVRFKISTPTIAYRLDIYRMGYYDGLGARKQATVFPLALTPQTQPACLTQASIGLVDCGNWADSAVWTIPSDAVSGIYFAKLVRTDTGGASHIVFVVRDDASSSTLLYQTSDETWQAYNSYGERSLYRDFTGTLSAGRAYKVSYNRPFNTRTNRDGLGQRSFVWHAEYPMVRWLEANGYNLSYMAGVDADRRGAGYIQQHGTYLSVGHDEYWSGNQRANVEAARAAGVNLAFFSGNQTFWKTRFENSIDGSSTPYRTLVTYKETHANAKIDPTAAWTGTWRDPRFSPPADGGRPENALSGQIFMVNGVTNNAMNVPFAYSRLRLWRNTPIASLSQGATQTITAGCTCLLGHEWDEDQDNGFRPAGTARLSSTVANVPQYLLDYGSTFGSGTATHNLTLYRASSGALVFGAGTIQWSWGLDGTHDGTPSVADVNIQQATVNVLADMGAQPSSPRPGLFAATQSTDTTQPTSAITSPANGSSVPNGALLTITGTASDSAGQVGGIEVSVDGGATWHPADGHHVMDVRVDAVHARHRHDSFSRGRRLGEPRDALRGGDDHRLGRDPRDVRRPEQSQSSIERSVPKRGHQLGYQRLVPVGPVAAVHHQQRRIQRSGSNDGDLHAHQPAAAGPGRCLQRRHRGVDGHPVLRWTTHHHAVGRRQSARDNCDGLDHPLQRRRHDRQQQRVGYELRYVLVRPVARAAYSLKTRFLKLVSQPLVLVTITLEQAAVQFVWIVVNWLGAICVVTSGLPSQLSVTVVAAPPL